MSDTNPLERDRLVSVLHRNSGIPCGMPALASVHDTSGRSDNAPVLAQHAEQGALFRPRTFYLAADSLPEPGECSVGKVPVGEPSLSGEPECLSLRRPILPQGRKNRKWRSRPGVYEFVVGNQAAYSCSQNES